MLSFSFCQEVHVPKQMPLESTLKRNFREKFFKNRRKCDMY